MLDSRVDALARFQNSLAACNDSIVNTIPSDISTGSALLLSVATTDMRGNRGICSGSPNVTIVRRIIHFAVE